MRAFDEKRQQNLISFVILFNLENCSRNLHKARRKYLSFFSSLLIYWLKRKKSFVFFFLCSLFTVLVVTGRLLSIYDALCSVFCTRLNSKYNQITSFLFLLMKTICGNKYTGHDDGSGQMGRAGR